MLCTVRTWYKSKFQTIWTQVEAHPFLWEHALLLEPNQYLFLSSILHTHVIWVLNISCSALKTKSNQISHLADMATCSSLLSMCVYVKLRKVPLQVNIKSPILPRLTSQHVDQHWHRQRRGAAFSHQVASCMAPSTGLVYAPQLFWQKARGQSQ